MAEEAASTSTEETQVTFNIKSSSDAKYVLTVPTTTTVADLKAKLSTPEYADIPVERQRLIYSGRVLKDPDTLAAIKIKDGHTVHLVKGAASNARQNPANQASNSSTATGATPAVPQVPTNLATGTGNNPLAGLTGARYAGFHGLPGADMFGPDGGMGPPPDPSQLLSMMDNPMFLSQMNEAMNNPAVIEMMQNSPMVRDNPMVAQMLRNPELRRMLFNPDMIRAQLQMQRAMGQGGGNAFPAPGVTDTTPQTGNVAREGTTTNPSQPNTTGSTQPQPNPFGLLGNTGAGGANPFAALFGGTDPFAPQTNTNANSNTTPATSPPPTASAGQGTPANPTPSTQPANPFANLFGAAGAPSDGNAQNPLAQMTQQMMQNPEAMRAAMQLLGGNPFGAPQAGNTGTGSPPPNPFANLLGPMGGLGGFNTPPPPVDNRPPEELYASQLRQLNDMGFYEFERNVQALRRSGGSVQGAIEFLLSGS
ncbi:hypothetical protein AOQ84DRAFT_226953 [Glonium stellatum]|uniref:Uncharacterized protein n=1 Tax=Glonium stellatum TaxID=574774 RepID=A0A8E2FAA2_9PEZI|nr:hypothetical protein AOQ84DRAFT_226953 [Glonium stellatum]